MLKLHFTLQLFYVAITDKKHLVKIWKWSWSFSLKYQFLPPQLWGHCHGSLLLVYIWKLKDAFCDTGKCRNIQHSSWRVGCYCINKHITKKKKHIITLFIIPCFVQMSNHRLGDGFPELPAVQHHRPAVLQPRRAGDHVRVPSHLQHLPAGGGSHICGKWVSQAGNFWQMGKVLFSFHGLVA